MKVKITDREIIKALGIPFKSARGWIEFEGEPTPEWVTDHVAKMYEEPKEEKKECDCKNDDTKVCAQCLEKAINYMKAHPETYPLNGQKIMKLHLLHHQSYVTSIDNIVAKINEVIDCIINNK